MPGFTGNCTSGSCFTEIARLAWWTEFAVFRHGQVDPFSVSSLRAWIVGRVGCTWWAVVPSCTIQRSDNAYSWTGFACRTPAAIRIGCTSFIWIVGSDRTLHGGRQCSRTTLNVECPVYHSLIRNQQRSLRRASRIRLVQRCHRRSALFWEPNLIGCRRCWIYKVAMFPRVPTVQRIAVRAVHREINVEKIALLCPPFVQQIIHANV
jgi:hypothetical protein